MKYNLLVLLVVISCNTHKSVFTTNEKDHNGKIKFIYKDKINKISECIDEAQFIRLANYDSVFNHFKHIESISIEMYSYYYDSSKCSGVGLYYENLILKDGLTLIPRWADGKPCSAFIFCCDSVIFFTNNKEYNQQLLIENESQLSAMSDSLKLNNDLLNNRLRILY